MSNVALKNLRAENGSSGYWRVVANGLKNARQALKARRKEEDGPEEEGPRYWVYALDQGASWEEHFSQGLIMVSGWDNLGDLAGYSSQKAIRLKMLELPSSEHILKMLGLSSSKDLIKTPIYIWDSSLLWQFYHDLREGDIIFAQNGMSEEQNNRIIGRGIVESGYMFRPERAEQKHVRKVKWTHRVNWENPGEIPSELENVTKSPGDGYYAQRLENLFARADDIELAEPEKQIPCEPYSDGHFGGEVFLSRERHETLKNLLKTQKNLILCGAPGVGKTFVAKRLAYSLIGGKDAGRVATVQFHQGYCYEDFIMGWRPVKEGRREIGIMDPGPFYTFCQKARADAERDYFFIIDRINLGDPAKIWRNAFRWIEGDKRGQQFELHYARDNSRPRRGRLFSFPENVHIIATMNPADSRSALFEATLRRRFAVFELSPAFDSAGFLRKQKNFNDPIFDALVRHIVELNREIADDPALGHGFCLGHSYFCLDEEEMGRTNGPSTESSFDHGKIKAGLQALVGKILPLLAEYWREAPEKAESWAERLRRVFRA